MPQVFDLIVKGGILVNHAWEGRRDIRIIADKIAAIGDLGRASAVLPLFSTCRTPTH